ncbi:hypothetical protein C475_21624 [Halosimplex carlsbadense 2-9-1]|uniref:Phytanoyl-CoA dioxygenase n=2 Tax=Halosimplex carlsbadense TaxID=171164 RepID=M0C9I3_9EURY|nr:hypothetical protein C475_21624 [Halosimplex carlsbadense 2-9-1]
MDDYLFDLRGFLVLEGALSESEVEACNDAVDEILPMEPDSWHGHVHRTGNSSQTSLQQIYELPPFETFVDHPSWVEYARRYVGGEGTFDYNHGPLYIDENFFGVFPPGEGTVLHSGGTPPTQRTQFGYHDDEFHCGQVNILVAMNDIGPGDGATMVVPGSHKSNFQLPNWENLEGDTLEAVPEAREVHLEAGDALLFVDSITHGSATRTNDGERRMCVFRYGPSWGVSRLGYEPSDELLDRLTPYQQQLVETFGSKEPKTPPAAGE